MAERAGTDLEASSARQLVVIRNGQRVFTEVVQEYLQRIEYAFVDPSRSFGSRSSAVAEPGCWMSWSDSVPVRASMSSLKSLASRTMT